MEGRVVSHREETKAPPGTVSEDWAQPSGKAWAFLPWAKLERHVYRLQKRIYRASEPWKCPGSPQVTTVVDALTSGPTVGSPEGHARQPGEKHPRSRRRSQRQPSRKAGNGKGDPSKELEQAEALSGAKGVDSQARKTREATARHTYDGSSRSPSTRETSLGAG